MTKKYLRRAEAISCLVNLYCFFVFCSLALTKGIIQCPSEDCTIASYKILHNIVSWWQKFSRLPHSLGNLLFINYVFTEYNRYLVFIIYYRIVN